MFGDDENHTDISLPEYKIGREKFLKCAKDDFNPIDDLKWVFQALGAEGLRPEDAPSPGAWSLLQKLKKDEVMLKNFYVTVFPKVIPNKSQMKEGEGEGHADDGREQFGIIERLLREPDDTAPVLSSTERRSRELAIS